MHLSAIGRTQRTHRELIAWFSSPRVAVRTAFRLAETVPSARVHVRRAEDHGAEGPVVALAAEIPWLWSTMVTRQLNGLGVAAMWDPDAGPDAGSVAGRDAGREVGLDAVREVGRDGGRNAVRDDAGRSAA